jgi:hypothetical protein
MDFLHCSRCYTATLFEVFEVLHEHSCRRCSTHMLII